jgi:hypothetical protein
MEILEANLFVNIDSLLANIVIATKSPDGLIDWIELKPEFHGSLIKCTLRLVSRHAETLKTASAKEALFPFLINLLNGRESRTTLFHKKKTATASKPANRKCDSEEIKKLKVQIDDTLEKSKVNVNDAADKKTPPILAVQALSSSEGIHPSPDPATITSATLPTLINHPPADPKATPQAGGPAINGPGTGESGCPGIHTHPMCEECHSMPAAGLKFNRYPKCVMDCLRRDGTYIDGYEDYSCFCAENYDHWKRSHFDL